MRAPLAPPPALWLSLIGAALCIIYMVPTSSSRVNTQCDSHECQCPSCPQPSTVLRTNTTPSFWIALKTEGSNSDFLTYDGGAQFLGGVYHNNHEQITAAFQHILNATCGARPTCAVDAGMNSGYYALLFAAMGCHVSAFEVQAELVALARNSSTLNGFAQRLNIHNMAVGLQSGGSVRIAVANGGNTWLERSKEPGHASVRRTGGAVGRSVPVSALDDIVQQLSPACGGRVKALKLDVEVPTFIL